MTYDQIQIVIFFTDTVRITNTDFFLIQCMDSALAVHAFQSRHARHIRKFVYIRRIYHERLTAVFRCKS